MKTEIKKPVSILLSLLPVMTAILPGMSVFVYFKTDDSAANTAGSTFTGGAGIALGALATAIGMTATKKKKEQAA